jgi:hypothetical protein
VAQRNRSIAAAWTAAFLALAAAVPAAADWLVTREGGRVETKGPWQVKGKLVVFTLADGKLSSLRLSEVDLDASRRASDEAAAAAQAAPAAPAQTPKREARVVLTDNDFRRGAPPPSPGAPAPAGEEKKEGEAGGTESGKVVVASWERAQGPGGNVVIHGTLRNEAPDDATGAVVTVLLYDETGKLLVSGDAVLSSTVLPAGQTGSFRAEFPDVFSFAAVKFDARGLHVLRKPGEPPKTANDN